MSRIKGKNTIPEIKVRSLLHRMGYRFQLHSKKIPGNPDIVLPKYKTVILVHGCYWHRHPGCKYAYTPKSRIEFWNKKFKANIKRDKFVKKELKNAGYKVIVIWECETKKEALLMKTLESLMIKL